MQHVPHHHGDDGEEIPVALHSSEAKRKHVGEENHGRAEADGAQDLWGGRAGGMKAAPGAAFALQQGFTLRTTEVRLLEVSRLPVWKEKRTMVMQDRMR